MTRQEKEKIRKQALSMRNLLSAEARKHKSAVISKKLIELLEDQRIVGCGQDSHTSPGSSAQRVHSTSPVMAYMPHRSEVDITAVLHHIWQQGKAVVLPRTIPNTRRMEPHLTNGWFDLRRGQWGIWEPDASTKCWDGDLSCILVPGVAFDEQGGRVGYGAGFYDRFFHRMLDEGKVMPVLIGIAYDVQVYKQLPVEPHDFPMKMIVTESRTID